MDVRIEPHTLRRAATRGVSLQEIMAVLRSGCQREAREGRLSRWLVFEGPFHWNGRSYPEKRVEVIFLQEGEAIITVTVYAMYGVWSA